MIDHSLKRVVEHIDITNYDVTDLVRELRATSFTSREIYNACHLYKQMLEEHNSKTNKKKNNKKKKDENAIDRITRILYGGGN